jgi:arsenite methyltransferase
MNTPTKIHEEVQKTYGEFAKSEASCCSPANKLYPLEVLQELPSDIANFSAGNGNPVTPANLQPGEAVLDLGSGGGLDCFLATRLVGESGRVIGVDMTPAMLERARKAAKSLGLRNVEFRQGYLEALPVEDNSVDVVISNCVINLSPDKPQVIHEMFRVLKPGGRISVSDTVATRLVPEERLQNMGDWCGCVSGALPYETYKSELEKAGFIDIQLNPNIDVALQGIDAGQVQNPDNLSREQIVEDLQNWQQSDECMFLPFLISARKPGGKTGCCG